MLSTLSLNILLLFCFLFVFVVQHVRVRFAACNALGQLSADFAPEFQRKYHSKVNMHECVHGVCVRACMVCAWCVLTCA